MMELVKRFRLQCAHFVASAPPDDVEARLHGHNFSVEVCVRGPLDEKMGWVVDFGEIKEAFAPVFARLDHQQLNEIEGLEEGSAETLARWIYDTLSPSLTLLHQVRVCETPERVGVWPADAT